METTTNAAQTTNASNVSEANTANTANNSIKATLERVAADYKLNAGESLLVQGRKDSKNPRKPYYHVIDKNSAMKNAAITFPAEVTANPSSKSALTKLWTATVESFLKEKAKQLDAGANITLTINTATILEYVANIGTNTRDVLSGAEIVSLGTTTAFEALASIHSWNTAQCDKVILALRQLAAPGFRHAEKDAKVLLARLAPMTELLAETTASNDDEAEHTAVLAAILAKLEAQSVPASVSLSDAI